MFKCTLVFLSQIGSNGVRTIWVCMSTDVSSVANGTVKLETPSSKLTNGAKANTMISRLV